MLLTGESEASTLVVREVRQQLLTAEIAEENAKIAEKVLWIKALAIQPLRLCSE
jgi:hypothetical protein